MGTSTGRSVGCTRPWAISENCYHTVTLALKITFDFGLRTLDLGLSDGAARSDHSR